MGRLTMKESQEFPKEPDVFMLLFQNSLNRYPEEEKSRPRPGKCPAPKVNADERANNDAAKESKQTPATHAFHEAAQGEKDQKKTFALMDRPIQVIEFKKK